MNPVRLAWRSLRRTPIFTATASLTLVLGFAASIAIFAVVNGVLLRPLPYGNPDRLIGAWHDLPPINLTKVTQTGGTTYKRLARTIEGIGVYEEDAVNAAEPGGAGEPQRLTSAGISADIVPVLQVSPLLGRAFTAEEDRPNGPSGESLHAEEHGRTANRIESRSCARAGPRSRVLNEPIQSFVDRIERLPRSIGIAFDRLDQYLALQRA